MNIVYKLNIDNQEYVYKFVNNDWFLKRNLKVPERLSDYEFFAYQLSEFLGFNCVPYTFKLDEGTVQEFIHGKMLRDKLVYNESLERALLFAYLIGNRDLHLNQFIVDENDKVWLFDNGFSFDKNSNVSSFMFKVWKKKLKDIKLKMEIKKDVIYSIKEKGFEKEIEFVLRNLEKNNSFILV